MNRIRQLINENPRVVITSFIVAVAVFVYIMMPGEEEVAIRHIPTIYVFDQNTGELLVMPADVDNPVETESGLYQGESAGVLAHVFSCGRCIEGPQFIGWLEKPDTSRPPLVIDDTPGPVRVDRTGESPPEPSDVLIRTPEDPKWVPYNSQAGRRIRDQVNRRCREGQSIRYCASPTMRAP